MDRRSFVAGLLGGSAIGLGGGFLLRGEPRVIIQSVPYPATLADLADYTLSDGVWSWFTDPRAIAINGRALIGSVDTSGNVEAWHATTTSPTAVTIDAAVEADDHVNPAFLRRASDGKILAWYSPHNGTAFYQALSTNADDPSAWGTPSNLDSSFGLDGYSYAIPAQLTGETNDPIYLFFRATVSTERAFHYSKSTDGGSTWGTPTRLLAGTYFYIKAVQNGTGRIDVAICQHPDDAPATPGVSGDSSLYHIYYEGGTWQEIGGSPLTLPITPTTDLTPIFDGSTSAGQAWVFDIAIDSSNRPAIAYAAYPTSRNPRYRYIRHNGTSWDDNEVAAGGNTRMIPTVSEQPYYTGGYCIDPDDANTVYFGQNYIEGWRIQRAVTADGGSTWTEKTLATAPAGDKAFNPVVARGLTAEPRLFYLEGGYEGGGSYTTDIQAIASDAAGADPVAPGSYAVTRVPLERGTGNMDIIIPGFGTPTAAYFVLSNNTPSSTTNGTLQGSEGAYDGTNQWYSSWTSRDNVAASTASRVWRRAGTTRCALLMGDSGTSVAGISGVSFVTDGVRVNVTENSVGGNYTLMVVLFNAANASVGTMTLATQNNSSTATPGFQTNALIVASHQDAFDNTSKATAIASTGFASYDGSTIRQCSTIARSDNTSPTNVQGCTRNDGVCSLLSGRYAELSSVTSTQFSITSRGADLSTISVGYLALGGVTAWAGVQDSPTATGAKSFTGTGFSFTPELCLMMPTMLSSINTDSADGTGNAWGISAFTDQAEFCNHWRDQDNVSTAVTRCEANANSSVAINTSDHAGTAAFDATFSSFASGQVNLNFTVTNGTARKFPMLAIA